MWQAIGKLLKPAIPVIKSAVGAGVSQGISNKVQHVVQGNKVPFGQQIAAQAYEKSFGQYNTTPESVPTAIKVANIYGSNAVKVAKIQRGTSMINHEMQMKHDAIMYGLSQPKGIGAALGDMFFGSDKKEAIDEYKNLLDGYDPAKMRKERLDGVPGNYNFFGR